MKSFFDQIGYNFNNRLSRPFNLAFFISWIIWNWEKVYVTFFVDQNKIEGTRIDYILNHNWNCNYLFWLPLFSTLVYLTIVQSINALVEIGNSFLKREKIKFVNKIKKRTPLPLEETIPLMEKIFEYEKNVDKSLESKNNLIITIKEEISNISRKNLELQMEIKDLKDNRDTNYDLLKSDYELLMTDYFINNEKLYKLYKKFYENENEFYKIINEKRAYDLKEVEDLLKYKLIYGSQGERYLTYEGQNFFNYLMNREN